MELSYELKKVGKSNGLFLDGIGMFGLIQNLPITLFQDSDGRGHLLLHIERIEEQVKDLLSVFENRKKDLRIKEVSCVEHMLHLEFKSFFLDEKLANKLRESIRLIDAFCEDKALTLLPNCQRCKEQKELRAYTLNENGVLLCEDCSTAVESEIIEINTALGDQERNHLKGFLGAVLFALPGVLLWGVLEYFLGVVSLATSILIAWLNFAGYTYFQGRQDQYAKWIIIGANMVSISLGACLIFLFPAIVSGVELTILLDALISNAEVQKEILRYVMVSVGLSIFAWWYLFVAVKKVSVEIKPAVPVRLH
ncbi:MAG: hypothetical protein AAFZ63_28365 [Bacteroidota bacterium]